MIVNKEYIKFKNIEPYLKCDICGSTKIRKNPEGFYVCDMCGTVLNEENFMDPQQYNPTLKDHEIFSPIKYTEIGKAAERINSRYTKLQFIQRDINNDHKSTMLRVAFREIKRLCGLLRLNSRFVAFTYKTFSEIWERLPPNKEVRSPKKLVPIIIYRLATQLNIKIDKTELIIYSGLNPIKFKKLYLKTYNFFNMTDKAELIKQTIKDMNTKIKEILKVTDKEEDYGDSGAQEQDIPSFNYVEHEIYDKAVKIYLSNREILDQTTKNIAAFTSLLLALLISDEMILKQIPIYKLLKLFQVSYKAVKQKVQKIIEYKRIPLSPRLFVLKNDLRYYVDQLIF